MSAIGPRVHYYGLRLAPSSPFLPCPGQPPIEWDIWLVSFQVYMDAAGMSELPDARQSGNESKGDVTLQTVRKNVVEGWPRIWDARLHGFLMSEWKLLSASCSHLRVFEAKKLWIWLRRVI